jgi:hypothetical protein
MIHCLCILIKNANYINYISFSKLNIDKFYIIDFINESTFTADFFYDFFKYFAIPFLLLIILTLILLLIINRYNFEKFLIPKNEIEIKIDGFLTEIIFSNYDAKHIKEKINLFKEEIPFKRKWCRDLIINKIITIKQNIYNINPNQLLLIYKYFGFQDYSKKLIRNRKWHRKTLGIYHYQMLDYKIKKGYIKPYINSKNKFLKSNALIALISLSDEKFEFLKNYQEKISRADELKILDIIYQNKSHLPKKINRWLHNENSSIVILAIKLMVQYRKTLKTSQISFLLSCADAMIRKETLLAIRELIITDSNDILINHYANETDKRNKISTLKTLGIIGNDKTKDYVSTLLLEEKDLEIKFEIINCINKIDYAFFKNYKIEDEIENDIINRIVLHVNNPYLI